MSAYKTVTLQEVSNKRYFFLYFLISTKTSFFLKTKMTMIYLLFLVTLLLISCNPDQAKDNGKDETIEYFIPLSHRVEKDVDEMFEEYRYVPLETRDDALIDVLYNVKNIAIFQEDIYIGSGEQLIVWDKYGKFKRVLSKKGNDPQSYLHFNHFMIWPNVGLEVEGK